MAPLIALTGATGFIGRHLLQALPAQGFRVRALLRRPAALPAEATGAVIGDIARPQNMAAALEGVDAIVHSAALTPGLTGTPADDYRAMNTEATVALARAAQRAGVKRFVFLSSIRAQAGPTVAGVLTEASPEAPESEYGRSKLAAERGLAALDLDWVALRPALVYGPGCRGNVAELLRLSRSSWPLPFGSLVAGRSLLALENLAGAVATVLAHPAPLRRAFVVADRDVLGVAAMIAAMRRGLGRPPGLVPIPVPLLRAGFAAAGRTETFRRLAEPLVVDAAALAGLGWTPTVATAAGLERLARDAG
ncbi:NAD(P)H-binding protein [Rhodoplanes sp. TEM]|uniref:NAD(P)H-binding protein n=1 Tax=Rhodoplanes tepidamans TaxID=200616 RepID=A0ABT5J4S8_RHOTP|nr:MULTISPECIES: NAD-dependent epimerase/dehydratase family protein [Rhodoplanes]MDC7784644.1 NAD(P)H-binding protein [Rhodoplanes tepidamans]MDC7982111.1 NAD(P)H-binding protein [Rhodoplanes sp. TEM]MDQ0356112.1 UDP-glucose 4-epimerase [Rhodoplanes tepidamans]